MEVRLTLYDSFFSLQLENPVVLLKTEDLKLKNESYKAKIPSSIDDRIFALVDANGLEPPTSCV